MKNKHKLIASKKELFYNDFSDQWESKINNLETEKRINVIFRRLLFRRDIKNKQFLEVGCGMGYFSERAFKLGAKVTGVDIGDKLVTITKSKVPQGKFLTASASSLPFRNSSFDVILSTEVVEHVEKQEKALNEMHRVLKKGGVLVITTPNKLFKPLFDFLSLTRIRPYHGNENWMYPWELKKYLIKIGFRLDGEYYFNFIMPNKFFDAFEQFSFLKLLMINYGFRLIKN